MRSFESKTVKEKSMIEMKHEAMLLQETSDTPVRDECDVLVVGGGTAGVMAALAAARNGAKTVLVEQNTFLGGALLGGGVILMGFYNIYKPYGLEPVQLIKGIPNEVIQRLIKEKGSTGFYEEMADAVHESVGLHVDREVLPQVLLDMLTESGVKIYFKTVVADTITEGDTVKGVILEGKSGREAILSKVTIDCSGEADVSYFAGVPCNEIPERCSAGMAFGLGNVDFEKARVFFEERKLLAYLGYADKGGEHKDTITRIGFGLKFMEEFKPYYEKYNLHQEPCIVSTRENSAGMINGVSKTFNTLDPRELSKAQIELTKCCHKMAELFKEIIPGFENSFVDWVSPTLGIRFGRHVECEYDITQADIEANKIPEDTIGLYGIQDAHFMGYDIKGGWYGIPYRAMIPKGKKNLLVAGKMISSDWVVWMSTRMTGSCFMQGQAVGTAAAIAAKENVDVRDISIEKLRASLVKDGAYLG